jgi:hypothetical protein
VHRALVGDLNQPGSLSLVQQSDQLDAFVDTFDHRLWILAIGAILGMDAGVLQADDDLLEGPLLARGVQIDRH